VARFHAAHDQTYGYSYAGHPEQRIEWVNVRVVGIGPLRRPVVRPRPRSLMAGPERARTGTRRVYFDAATADTPIYARARLQPGDCLDGPGIVEEFGSTTVVFPGQRARVDDFGNLLLERSA
jgi:N-methylhydantoinase A